MKREILFRAKRVDNGEWVFGTPFLIAEENICFILNNCSIAIFENHEADFSGFKCYRETLGQFTGLTDKNGVKVFDGDLLEDNYNEEETLIDGKVEVVFDVKKAEWAIDNSFKQDKSSFTSLVGYLGEELKVIGNIHDNEK